MNVELLESAFHNRARCAEQQRIKLALKTAIATAINTFECAPKIRTGTSTFGRKSKDEKWNELCVELIRCELSKPGVDLTDLIILGPKPQMPGNWDGTPILRGLPGPAAIPDAAPVANVKRGKYHKLEPELKYQFFETHRLLKNKSIRETMAWFNEHLPLVYCTGQPYTISSRSGGQVHLSD